MSPLKTIGACLGGLLLLPVFVISAVAGGSEDLSAASDGSQQAPVDGAEPGGLETAVLFNPSIHLRPAARGDIEAGLVDPRVLQVLLLLAQTHELQGVGPFVSGHSYYVKGTAQVSNHVSGRAVDIGAVDGQAVSPANQAAHEVMETILALPSPYLPDELGGPWLLRAGPVRVFTEGHSDHIHIGFDSR